jgi:hypothetical protein
LHHSFDTEHARLYGLTEAVLIANFQFWIVKNRANGENLIDGRTWTYNSVRAWAEIFPYFTVDQVRRGIGSLVKQGILVSGNFNASAVDRTKWYAFEDEKAFLPDSANVPNGRLRAPNAIGETAKSLIDTDSDHIPGRGSRLPRDWVLPKKWGEAALQRFPHWTAEYVRETVAVLFRNHWVGKAGKDAVKVDWPGTWENWCINQEHLRPFKNPAMPSPVQAGEWWKSKAGIEAKGAELGLALVDDESFPYYKLRVYAAAGDGPWHDAADRAAAPRVEGMKKAGAAVDVAAERERMKQITRRNAAV